MNRSFIFVFITLLIHSFDAVVTSAQTSASQVTSSPNAGSLGVYGQIPVSLFNGLANIAIPLGSIKVDDCTVPINLRYHGGGIRPDQHPSWVGLGWDLDVGGVINRIVKGGVDEYFHNDSSKKINSYYLNHVILDSDEWSSKKFLQDRFTNVSDIVAPVSDEFIFTFGKYSGKFYLNHEGKWKVATRDPIKIDIQEEIATSYKLPTKTPQTAVQGTLPRIFFKFRLTTPDGFVYIFGGNDNSIEFTRQLTTPFVGSWYNYVIPSAWFLSEIVTNKNEHIYFEYERMGTGITLLQSNNGYLYGSNIEHIINNLHTKDPRTSPSTASKLTALNNVYLKKIVSRNATVNFFRSESVELKNDISNYNLSKIASLSGYYPDLTDSSTLNAVKFPKWYKLDSISFDNNGKSTHTLVFSYTENQNTRLILNSISDACNPQYKFKFEYFNPELLPKYNTGQLDHWGFYNGKNFWDDIQRVNKEDVEEEHVKSRKPNFELTKYGSLTSVTYPTGGKTVFEYELHSFSKVFSLNPLNSQQGCLKDSIGLCGGLRISRIVNMDADGSILNAKKYLFVKGYTGSVENVVSSGILGGVPKYFYKISQPDATNPDKMHFQHLFIDPPIETLSYTEGSHVTYGEVVELNADNSYTVYKYTNSEMKELLDAPAFNSLVWDLQNPASKSLPVTSKALYRGKLISRERYNDKSELIKSTKMLYSDIPGSDSEDAVRCVDFYYLPVHLRPLYNVSAYLVHTSPQYLLSQTETICSTRPASSPIVNTRSYTYNNFYRQLSKISGKSSEGKILNTYFRYPYDVSDYVSNSILSQLVKRNQLDVPIETVQTFRLSDGVEYLSYASAVQINSFNGALLPEKYFELVIFPKTSLASYTETKVVESNLQMDPRMVLKEAVNYGKAAKLIERQKTGQPVESYLWGYNNEYPVVKVIGAPYAVVEKIVDTGVMNDPVKMNSEISVLRNHFAGSAVQVGTYTYQPGVGMISSTDPSGRSTFYEYDSMLRLKNVKNTDGDMVRGYLYNYAQAFPQSKKTVMSQALIGDNASSEGSFSKVSAAAVTETGVSF